MAKPEIAPGPEGPLAKYLINLSPLSTPCSFVSKTGVITVSLNPYESVVISRRLVDSAILVQGDVCIDSSGAAPVTAVMSKAKTINVGADATSGTPVDLSSTSEIVVLDLTNGTFGLASSSGGGIFIDLGGGADSINVLGSKATDKIGCTRKVGQDYLGLVSTTGADVKIASYSDNTFMVDLAEGSDTFDKGACTTKVDVYGGAGIDTLLAGTDVSTTGDHYHGGSDVDTISYAARTQSVVVVADGATDSGDPSGEQDLVDADIESIVGGSGDDTLTAAVDAAAKHRLNGGNGNDTLISTVGGGTTFVGGAGVDTADYSARTHGVTVTMSDGKANDGQDGDLDNIGLDVENLIGSSYADLITGSGVANVITPGAGNDTINAGDGDDIIIAGASVDGNDTINGGKGTDTVNYSERATGVCVVLDGTSRSGSCSFAMGNAAMSVSASDSDIIGLDVENVIGTADDDHLIGNTSPNALIGLGGDDWLEGKSGDDQLDSNLYTTVTGNTCNPQSRTCFGAVTGTCDCGSSALTPSCSSSALLSCGGDPLDIGSCKDATSDQFIACWRTQL